MKTKSSAELRPLAGYATLNTYTYEKYQTDSSAYIYTKYTCMYVYMYVCLHMCINVYMSTYEIIIMIIIIIEEDNDEVDNNEEEGMHFRGRNTG